MNNYVKPRPTFPKRAVITGGMPYGNKTLHFGHVAMMLRADTFARFMRDRIGSDNVIFVSGTDCYGSPAVESFRKLSETGQITDKSLTDFVQRKHLEQIADFQEYGVSFNLFSASAFGESKDIHEKTSQEFIENLYKAKKISKQSSWQFFDPKFNQFLNGRQVVGKCPIEGCQSESGFADECGLGHQYMPQDLINPISTLSGEPPILKKVENWYFNLDECLPILNQWIEDLGTKSDSSSFMIKEIKEFFKKPEIYVKREYASQLHTIGLPAFEITGKETAPSITIVFNTLKDREKACEILSQNGIRYRTGKTLTPFRLTGDLDWGVPCPEIEGLANRTFYVWPESLWAPISFTKAYLKQTGAAPDKWKEFWCSTDCGIYQFIGEDNMYFYGPAQQAIWLYTQGEHAVYPAPNQALQTTNIVPIKSLLYMNQKASSSSTRKPPSARELLAHYTPEQFRMHVLGMNLGNNNISFSPKCFDTDASIDTPDLVLKEGNLLTNVYNRILRTLFYSTQKEFNGKLPYCQIDDQVKQQCKKAILDYERFMYEKKFHQVINVVDVFVRNINKYWVKEINQATTKELLASLIANTAQYIQTANVLLHPMASEGTEKVQLYLGLDDRCFNWDYIFEDIYFFMDDPQNHTLKQLQEKEDFFKKHPSQLEELANKANK